jgi:hypothetical protein
VPRCVPASRWPAIKDELFEEYPDDGRPLSSVLSGGITEIVLESRSGQFQTKGKPQWE